MGGNNLYLFTKNSPLFYWDPHGLKIRIMGDDALRKRTSPDFPGEILPGDQDFADEVLEAFQAGVSKEIDGKTITCLKLSMKAKMSGKRVGYWQIHAERGPDYNSKECQDCINAKRILDAINDGKVMNIFKTEFPFDNAYHYRLQFSTGSYVYWDPSIRPEAPTMNDKNEIANPMPMHPHSVLWHESIGHGGLNLEGESAGHPPYSWNEWDVKLEDNPNRDPTLEIQNEYERWRGFPLRYPRYYPDGKSPQSENPGAYEDLNK